MQIHDIFPQAERFNNNFIFLFVFCHKTLSKWIQMTVLDYTRPTRILQINFCFYVVYTRYKFSSLSLISISESVITINSIILDIPAVLLTSQ